MAPMAPMSELIGSTESSHQQHGRNPATLAGLLLPHLVCSLFVAARAWSRLQILSKWFIDDTLMLLAWIFSTAVCIVYTLAAESSETQRAAAAGGMTVVHSEPQVSGNDWSGDQTQLYLFQIYLGLIFYQVCLCLTKLSILSFYLRMFSSSRPLERTLAWSTVAFVVAFGIPLLVASIFQCRPGVTTTATMCFPFTPLLIASASLHSTTDAWLIALVIPCIWRLDIAPRQKAALGIVLSLGVFVIAASLTRLQLSLHANYRPGGGGAGAGNSKYNTLAFFVMTVLECDVAIICASAPTLRPLLARLWPRSGMGDPFVFRRRSRQKQQQQLRAARGGSFGYPWAAAKTTTMEPGAKKGQGQHDREVRSESKKSKIPKDWCPPRQPPPAMPIPPAAALTATHRTLTTLSLRSLISVVSPRSRAATLADSGEDKTVLLLLAECDGGRKTAVRDGGGPPVGTQAWANSQESFVMGMNDPASPRRTSFVLGGHRDASGSGGGEGCIRRTSADSGWLSGETTAGSAG